MDWVGGWVGEGVGGWVGGLSRTLVLLPCFSSTSSLSGRTKQRGLMVSELWWAGGWVGGWVGGKREV